jgi:hypothetical protein
MVSTFFVEPESCLLVYEWIRLVAFGVIPMVIGSHGIRFLIWCTKTFSLQMSTKDKAVKKESSKDKEKEPKESVRACFHLLVRLICLRSN